MSETGQGIFLFLSLILFKVDSAGLQRVIRLPAQPEKSGNIKVRILRGNIIVFETKVRKIIQGKKSESL